MSLSLFYSKQLKPTPTNQDVLNIGVVKDSGSPYFVMSGGTVAFSHRFIHSVRIQLGCCIDLAKYFFVISSNICDISRKLASISFIRF